MTEEEGLRRLRSIVDQLDKFGQLGWYATTSCLNGHLVRYSVLDSSSVSAEGVRCSECNQEVLSGDLRVHDETVNYRSMFQDSIELLAMTVSARTHFGSDVPVVLAHTSLEVFLRQAVESKLRERAVDDKVAGFVLNNMRPDVRTYLDCLETLGAIKNKNEKFLNGLREVSEWRNAFIHRAEAVTDEQALRACEKIAEAFVRLGDLVPPTEVTSGPKEV